MDDFVEMDVAEQQPAYAPVVEETSTEYLGHWNKLVSHTNWEKGRIICAWRTALAAADAPEHSFTDEAWSLRVGNVTPQHVGRLRRVYERFAGAEKQYPGLYWSHFQAAMDWIDAEMWLEGASQNGWSIADMRRQRCEALGAPDELKPREEDVVQAELDEDTFQGAESDTVAESFDEVQDTRDGVDAPPFDTDDQSMAQASVPDVETETPLQTDRPFENLGRLPDDLHEAMDLFRLAILSHKVSGWTEVALDDVLSALEALKRLAIAPGGN